MRWRTVVIVGGVVAVLAALALWKGKDAARAILAKLTRSGMASAKHLSNAPDDAADKQRLLWLDERRRELEPLLRKKLSGVRMTSAYRSDAVNAAVRGSKTSRHRYGLALDFGDGHTSDYRDLARFLRDHVHELRVTPRDVLAETTPPHLHVDFYDPLRLVDSGSGPTRFKQEIAGNADHFMPLA